MSLASSDASILAVAGPAPLRPTLLAVDTCTRQHANLLVPRQIVSGLVGAGACPPVSRVEARACTPTGRGGASVPPLAEDPGGTPTAAASREEAQSSSPADAGRRSPSMPYPRSTPLSSPARAYEQPPRGRAGAGNVLEVDNRMRRGVGRLHAHESRALPWCRGKRHRPLAKRAPRWRPRAAATLPSEEAASLSTVLCARELEVLARSG
jgi:hypothetical protein